jgi:hypothetical protein
VQWKQIAESEQIIHAGGFHGKGMDVEADDIAQDQIERRRTSDLPGGHTVMDVLDLQDEKRAGAASGVEDSL